MRSSPSLFSFSFSSYYSLLFIMFPALLLLLLFSSVLFPSLLSSQLFSVPLTKCYRTLLRKNIYQIADQKRAEEAAKQKERVNSLLSPCLFLSPFLTLSFRRNSRHVKLNSVSRNSFSKQRLKWKSLLQVRSDTLSKMSIS